MSQVFEAFPCRRVIDLSGLWDFQPALKAGGRPKAYGGKATVPGVWETLISDFQHRGYGWYRREVEIAGTKRVWAKLRFEAVSHTATVWLDGRKLGSHYGAHTAFEFQTRISPGLHTLTVLVDNTYGLHNPLFNPKQDIYLYGGIVRPARIEFLPDVAMEKASALPRRTASGWVLDVSIRLRRLQESIPWPRHASVVLDGKPLAAIPVSKSGLARASLPVRLPSLWSPDHPRLSTVRIVAGEDVWQKRIGFRTIETRGKKILLNGQPLILKGVNRHEFHPDFGPALPLGIHLRDIEILKTLGANFVRGSHYPNDETFLDLCDENGILFWEELSHWQPSVQDFATPVFLETSLRQADEMVEQHCHHPSIIMWGMLNEAQTHKAPAKRIVRSIARRFRKMDPSRLVTFASNHPTNDLCYDHVDVVSINIYPGWYDGFMVDVDEMATTAIKAAIRLSRGKPMILSEFGAAGINGVRSMETRKWTENYQAELLRKMIDLARNGGRISGVAVWQYCDVRTSRDRFLTRVREYNNKGIVTEWREPKMAFYAVQECFAKPWKLV